MEKDDKKGVFSGSLFSLQLQIQHLLEGAGGEEASKLLDSLTELNQSEQTIALGIFQRVIDRIQSGEQRLLSAEDEALKKFEDDLYGEIVNSLERAAAGGDSRRFELVNGGKVRKVSRPKSQLIDFQAAREARLAGEELVN